MNATRPLGRAAAVAAALAGTLLLAGPAFAHVEVQAQPAQALATNAVVTFSGEAESQSAGIAKVQVVLPEGITPADVTLAQAPQGWAFTATADGYTVGGPALAPGEDAVHKITVRQLPNAKELVFKTLETYSDGHIDRWIELPQNGATPEHPAPVLELAPAAPGAGMLSPTTTAGSPTPASPTASASVAATPEATPSSSAPASSTDGGNSAGAAIAVAAAVVVIAAAGAWWWRRQRGTTTR
ncbi:uncharacterized protein YcnI [Streptomyces sp. TLI_235]|nr:DUF1775 domain-containing protein [Streptomyces sp. TLI_235]PBC75607.1 uncharacterized protein YcnI [Streptomyces sp. TLI_235]